MATDILSAAVRSKETLIGRVKGVQKNFKVTGVRAGQVDLEVHNPWPDESTYRQTVAYSDIDFADSSIQATKKDGKWYDSADLEKAESAPKRTSRSRSTTKTAAKKPAAKKSTAKK